MADALRWMPMALHVRTFRRVLLALLTTLVLVQSVGVLHRVAHAHHSSSMASTQVPIVDDAPPHAGATLLARLWGEHSSLADCQLFDQTCPDLLLTSISVWMPLLPAPIRMAAVLQERFALFARFYAARGPPFALI